MRQLYEFCTPSASDVVEHMRRDHISRVLTRHNIPHKPDAPKTALAAILRGSGIDPTAPAPDGESIIEWVPIKQYDDRGREIGVTFFPAEHQPESARLGIDSGAALARAVEARAREEDDALAKENAALRATNDALEARLAALEERIMGVPGAAPPPPPEPEPEPAPAMRSPESNEIPLEQLNMAQLWKRYRESDATGCAFGTKKIDLVAAIREAMSDDDPAHRGE